MGIKRWIRDLSRDAVGSDIIVLNRRLDDVTERISALTDLERTLLHERERLSLTLDVINERIENGNRLWRAIRARERREEQRAEGDEEQDPYPQLQLFDEAGGSGEGLPPMHRPVDRAGKPLTAAQEVGQAIARRIAGLE